MVNFSMDAFINTIEAYEDSKNLFADKAKPTAKASLGKGTPGNNPNGQRNDRSSKPPPSPQVIQKLKTNAQDTEKKWEVSEWKMHQNECTSATFETNALRICYWCIEADCLKSRGETYRNKGKEFQMARGADYPAWRVKMDKNTKNMCPNFTALNGRLPGGAKVGKAVIGETKVSHVTPEIQEPADKVIHCHTACIKYPADQPYNQPTICENNRKNEVRCPVRELGEHHDCDIQVECSEGELVRVNKTRADQNQHRLHGCYWGMESLELVCVAPRDTVISGNSARQMSVTVKDSQVEEQEDFNSTSENILDDDALYEQ